MESPAGPRTQRAGRRKWPDVPAQEWSWKLRRTLERRTEPHLSPPLDLTPRDRCQVRVNDGERTGTFITPFTEKKRNIHTQQREVGLEACYSRGGICRGVDSRRASPLKRTSVRGPRGVGLSQKLCGMERLRLRGFGEDRSYTIQGFQGFQAFLHCSPN